jgi:hypothetical protein
LLLLEVARVVAETLQLTDEVAAGAAEVDLELLLELLVEVALRSLLKPLC